MPWKEAWPFATRLEDKGGELLEAGEIERGATVVSMAFEISRSGLAWVALGKGFEMSRKWQDARAAYQRAVRDSRTDEVRAEAEDCLRQLEAGGR